MAPSASHQTAASPLEGPQNLDSFLQHRLFQGWSGGGSAGGGSSSSQSIPRGSGYDARRQPALAVEEPEEVVQSDEDDGVPSNPQGLEPGDRVRRARNEDGSTVMVRFDGGWMIRKSANADPSLTVGTEKEAAAVTNGAMDVEDAPEDAASMKQRILERAAARKASGGATSSGLPVRYKNELIEAAVNAAQSSSHKRKTSFTPGTITAVASGHASAVMIEQTLRDLRESYQMKPSLCYLSMEDGGVRFASVSFAQVPRSLHPMCATSVMCGVCLQYNDSSETNAGAVTENKSVAKKGSKKRPHEALSPQDERFKLTRVQCGNIHYPVHNQCLAAVAGDFLPKEQRPRNNSNSISSDSAIIGTDTTDSSGPVITLSSPYEYEQADDAECDLCGRKGGVLRYFKIDPSCSSVPAPAAEGWLAHVPCIQFLSGSKQLAPLLDVVPEVGPLHFAQNPLSCDIATGSSSASALKVPATGGNENVDSALNESTAEEDSGEPAAAEALLKANRLHAQPPLSRFDQQFGHWRCTLCGLQCGLAVRCLAAGCTIRAHPVCVTAVNHPMWRVCSLATRLPRQAKRDESVSMGILCPLHSGGLDV
jgi:hypothetical protein